MYAYNYRCSVSQLQKQFLLFQAKEAIQSNPFTATDRIVDAAVTKSNKEHHVLPDKAVVENLRKLVQRYRSAQLPPQPVTVNFTVSFHSKSLWVSSSHM